jgi:serine/threonine protein phosphatase PrpC
MSFLTFGLSSQCKNKNHTNQDKFGSITVKTPSGKEILVAAVSDGVSMCYKGEVASYNTVRFILNWSAEYFSGAEFDASIISVEFDKLITNINHALNNYAKLPRRKKLKENYSPYSSCTLCCVITDGNEILYFGIGDSAIYELKSYTAINIMDNGRANKHINASGRLTSYIGGIEDEKIDIRYIENRFDSSAAYFICTDGMYGKMVFDTEKDEDFRKFNQRLLSADSRSAGITVLQGMTDYVLAQGETDDITALVVKEV